MLNFLFFISSVLAAAPPPPTNVQYFQIKADDGGLLKPYYSSVGLLATSGNAVAISSPGSNYTLSSSNVKDSTGKIWTINNSQFLNGVAVLYPSATVASGYVALKCDSSLKCTVDSKAAYFYYNIDKDQVLLSNKPTTGTLLFPRLTLTQQSQSAIVKTSTGPSTSPPAALSFTIPSSFKLGIYQGPNVQQSYSVFVNSTEKVYASTANKVSTFALDASSQIIEPSSKRTIQLTSQYVNKESFAYLNIKSPVNNATSFVAKLLPAGSKVQAYGKAFPDGSKYNLVPVTNNPDPVYGRTVAFAFYPVVGTGQTSGPIYGVALEYLYVFITP